MLDTGKGQRMRHAFPPSSCSFCNFLMIPDFCFVEVRRSTEWTSWARVNETRDGRIERRYKVVCKANIPQQTDLRVQVKTKERFCAAGSDDTCAGEKMLVDLDLGDDDLVVAPDLEPLLTLLAMAVCKNTSVDDADVVPIQRTPTCCGRLVNGTCVCADESKKVNETANESENTTLPMTTSTPEINVENASTVGAHTESPSPPLLNPLVRNVTSASTKISPGDVNVTDNVNSTINDTECRNKTDQEVSEKLQNKKDAVKNSKKQTENKVEESNEPGVQGEKKPDCDCKKLSRKPYGAPWSHNSVFKGYCKCRNLGMLRICRKCMPSIPRY